MPTRRVLPALVFVSCLLLSSGLARAAALDASRGQTTVTLGRNIVTVDSDVRYSGYQVGERVTVTLEYSASCNVVFNELILFKPIPFSPPRVVTGEIGNIRGTPRPGRAATTGSVTFDIRFTVLNNQSPGTQSGLARLNLVLGVDQDCDLATGDPDGVERATPVRVQIRVSTGEAD